MGDIGMIVELALVALLAATLLQAIRLQRALSALRQDRAALEAAVDGFDQGTRAAEAGLFRLREAADTLAGQLGQAAALRDDLAFLSDRGEGLADQLDSLVRAGRATAAAASPPSPMAPYTAFDLPPEDVPAPPDPVAPPLWTPSPQPLPRVRSGAERSLLLAMQARS